MQALILLVQFLGSLDSPKFTKQREKFSSCAYDPKFCYNSSKEWWVSITLRRLYYTPSVVMRVRMFASFASLLRACKLGMGKALCFSSALIFREYSTVLETFYSTQEYKRNICDKSAISRGTHAKNFNLPSVYSPQRYIR